MEVAEALKHKRRYVMIVRAVSAVSAFWFPFSFLAFLDPPEPKGHLFSPAALKVVCALLAGVSIWWTLKRGVPALQQAESVVQLFLRSLICVQGTFLCATLGLFAFIADSPHLGSPLIVLPFVVAAVWVDWRYILPQMEAYEPTQRDLRGSAA